MKRKQNTFSLPSPFFFYSSSFFFNKRIYIYCINQNTGKKCKRIHNIHVLAKTFAYFIHQYKLMFSLESQYKNANMWICLSGIPVQPNGKYKSCLRFSQFHSSLRQDHKTSSNYHHLLLTSPINDSSDLGILFHMVYQPFLSLSTGFTHFHFRFLPGSLTLPSMCNKGVYLGSCVLQFPQ